MAMIVIHPDGSRQFSALPRNGCELDSGWMRGGVRTVLRLEGAVVVAVSLTAFAALHANRWLFAALFLTPDLAFLAYLAGPRVGAAAYNGLHAYVAPLLLGLIAHLGQAPSLMPVAVVRIAHIGFDRAAGYGLKYASAFGDTHPGRKGPERNHADAA